MGWFKKFQKFLKKAAPIITAVVLIVAPELVTVVGKSLGATTAASQAAAGAAAISAGTTAVAGGTPEEIVRSGVAGGAGGYFGVTAGEAAKAGQIAGSLPAGTYVPAAASAAAGTGAQTLVQTGDVGKAAEAALLAGAAGGAGEFASSSAQELLPASTGRTTQAVTAGLTGGATEAAVRGEDPLTGAALSALGTATRTGYEDLAAEQAEKDAARQQVTAAFQQPRSPGVGTQIGEPVAELGSDVTGTRTDSPAFSQRIDAAPAPGEERSLPPVEVTAKRDSISPVTKSSLILPPKISDKDRAIMETTGILPAPQAAPAPEPGAEPQPEEAVAEEPTGEEKAAEDRRKIGYVYQNMSPLEILLGQYGTGGGVGSSALAQALTVGDPGESYLGKKGKDRKPVWNVESLKLTDELGGSYG
jgi:hypothetical protein